MDRNVSKQGFISYVDNLFDFPHARVVNSSVTPSTDVRIYTFVERFQEDPPGKIRKRFGQAQNVVFMKAVRFLALGLLDRSMTKKDRRKS